MVQFNKIPGNLRVPFVRIEVNAGQSPYQSISRLLLIGQMLAAGTALPNVPMLVTGSEDGLFGVGSHLAAMYKTARANAPFQEIWALPVSDAVGATKAAGSIVVSGTAPVTAPGTIVVYIGGIRVQTPVDTTMTAAQIATALSTAINACPAMQADATIVTPGTVTLTASNGGTLGNGIGIYTRLSQDDGPFADAMLTITQMTGGTGDPILTTAIANLGEDKWDFIALPWATSTYLNTMDAWLSSRWGPMSQTYGTYYTAMVGVTAGTTIAATSIRNGQFGSLMPMQNSPQPAYLIAAAYAAQAAQHLQDAPELSRPLQTVELVGILPPKAIGDRWTTVQRQSFYYAGASAYIVGPGGSVMIDRAVTFYQKDAWGDPDQSFLDVNTLAQLMYGLRYISAYVTETYPRAALVTSNPNNIQGFVTPQDIANAMVHAYSGLVDIGVFQDVATFQSLLEVQANPQDPNRIDTFLPVEAVNGLRVLAINATSYLQYPTT